MSEHQEQSLEQSSGESADFASFDELVETLARWSGSLPEWPPARAVRAEWEQIERFADFVNEAGYASPIRTPRGRDILAACGQLRSESVKEKASERLKARLAEKEASAES